MSENTLNNELRFIVGDDYFLTDPDQLYNYSRDCTTNDEVRPNAVIIPKTVEEVAKIAKSCNESNTKLTIRGGGTGVSKGALAHNGGIVLSMERLNRIIEINKVDRIAIVETGVITQTLQEAVKSEGLYFPQNISSSDSCFIGGNIAVSSGSPKSLKYGPTKNYVLNLEVVLPSGQIMWTGKNVNKNATGYNLTQLFSGSEGTLGIITKAVLQLVPPVEEILIMVPFSDINHLFDCVHQFFVEGHSASSIEFIDSTGYQVVSKFLSREVISKNKVAGILWIELEGENQESLLNELTMISELIYRFTNEEIFIAQSNHEIKQLWTMRSKIGEAVINSTSFRDVDIVVPRSKIHKMYSAIDDIASKHSFQYTALGHIGNGNFHVNIFQNKDLTEKEWKKHSDEGIREIFEIAVSLGGTISGEHGIGKIHQPFLKIAIPEYQLDLMHQIKNVFDKNNILNSNSQ